MFYVNWELGGRKNLRVGNFFEKKPVRVGLEETNNFLGVRRRGIRVKKNNKPLLHV